MGGFGQYLVEKGVLDTEQLEEALRFQRVYGDPMGTAVVDLGYLVVEELAEHLSDAIGVPLPQPEWLESPDPQALDLVPPPIVRRCQVLPLCIEGGGLHVAMLDPTDPEKLDLLAMASSRRVVPYVLPERKLLYWLEMHCGIDRPPRFLGMLTRPRQIGLTKEEVESGTPMLDTRERIDHMASKAKAREELLPEAGDGEQPYQPLSLGTPIEDDAPPPPAAEVTRAEEDDEKILLLDELVIPTNAPSLFTHPAQTGLPFRGPPPHGGVDGRVLDGLDRDAVQEILVHPIIIRDRVVNLLYADNGPEIFGETSIGALTALSHTLAGACERLIADQRRQRQG